MKKFFITGCGGSSYQADFPKYMALSEHDALAAFAKDAAEETGWDEWHFITNFEAIED